jgi:hypothetical protein
MNLSKIIIYFNILFNQFIQLHFIVTSKVFAGKVFTIHVFVVNRSKHVRRFTVMVPNKKRPNEK